jgi:hypothetical protein
MAAGIGNPVGYVPVFDGGNPRIITGIAGGNISGGALVFVSGAADVVSSGLSTYVTSDVKFLTDASGAQFNGIALHSAGSNTYVSVATRGIVIGLSDGTVIAGYPVIVAGANAFRNGVGTGSLQDCYVGRAFSSAGSEGYCLIDIWG